jgi:hypothetical protein
LYQLSSLGADTGVPIEVLRTPDGRVRVSGTVNTAALRDAIGTQLRKLDGHERLDLRIVSSAEFVVPPGSKRSAPVEAYEVTQPGFAANSRIRGYVQAKGVSGERLDAAVVEFSRDALQHAQRALQHAYALDRLGTCLSAGELRSVNLSSQREWTEMVNNHAKELENELRSLRTQVQEISSPGDDSVTGNPEKMGMDDPEHFAKATGLLLRQVRDLNQRAGAFFASTGKIVRQENLDASLKAITDAIPLKQAEQVTSFAARLGSKKSTAQR